MALPKTNFTGPLICDRGSLVTGCADRMNNFLSHMRVSSKKRVILGLTGMLYVGYLGAVVFCHCLEGIAHHAKNQQAHEEPVAVHTHEGSHKHSQEHPVAPHSCDCPEIESAILVSFSAPAFVKHDCVAWLVVASFSATPLPASPPFHLLNFNHHGPPQQVPIHIKNQVFLI